MLLALHLQLTSSGKDGLTPLQHAAEYGSCYVAAELVRSGAQVSEETRATMNKHLVQALQMFTGREVEGQAGHKIPKGELTDRIVAWKTAGAALPKREMLPPSKPLDVLYHKLTGKGAAISGMSR